jgi:tetratricopeptide (TPR) repeat protein
MRYLICCLTILLFTPALSLAQAPAAPRGTIPVAPTPRAGSGNTGGYSSTNNLALADSAVKAIDAGTLPGFGAEVEQQARASLVNVKSFDPLLVSRMAAFREFARFFGNTRDLPAPQKQALKWLATREKMLYPLMSAVGKEKPREVVDRLTALVTDNAMACENDPDLLAALLVVPNRQPYGQIKVALPDDTTPLRLFHYYTSPRTALQISVHDLPWQLAEYVIDNKLSDADIQWVASRYLRHSQIGTIYFDVPYDTSAYLNGSSRQIESRAYTMPNLQQYGGVCIDQAFFATQAAKTLGVPACICTGEGGAGQVAHAWVGYLQIVNRRAKWNFDEGRYKEFLFWSAQIIDPQTQEVLSDADVGLLAELQNVSEEARLQSSLLLKLADLVDEKQRLAFLERIISLSPGNRPAWVALADLASQGKLTPVQSDEVARTVKSYAAVSYPDFAYSIFLKMAAGTAPDAQVKALDKIAAIFPNRPDLLARIHIRQGALEQEARKYDLAMVAYGDVLTKELNAGPIVLDAMQRVDTILRDQKDLPRLSQVYNQVWHKMPAPDASGFAAGTPYYVMGQSYALLLDELGNRADADAVRSRLAQLTPANGQTKHN